MAANQAISDPSLPQCPTDGEAVPLEKAVLVVLCLLATFPPAWQQDFSLPGFTWPVTKCHRQDLTCPERMVWYFQLMRTLVAAQATLLDSAGSSARERISPSGSLRQAATQVGKSQDESK